MHDSLTSVIARLSKMVRRILGKAMGQDSVDEKLVKAVVLGQGNRRKLERIGGGKARIDLVLFDTDGIGAYVFESSRPPVIAGASHILHELNKDIARRFKDHVVFSAGGEGLMLAPPGRGADLCGQIEGRYREVTCGALSVTTTVIEVPVADFVIGGEVESRVSPEVRAVTGTRAVLARLRDAVRAKKESKKGRHSHIEAGSVTRCVSCRDRVGTLDRNNWRRDEPVPLLLCTPCERRWSLGKDQIKGTSLEALVAAWQKRNPLDPTSQSHEATSAGEREETDREGEAKGKSSYVGFVYTDGNGMGQAFGELGCLAELAFASGVIADVFRQAETEVIHLANSFGIGQDEYLSLLGGGDEKIWILPAPLAVRVCRDLPGWLERATAKWPDFGAILKRKEINRKGLTLGTGLAICQYKYPVRYQYELAQALQKSAKTQFYGGSEDSFLDFAVVTDASPLADDLAAARRTTYASEDPDFNLVQRPFSRGEWDTLLKKLRPTASMGRSQVYQLREAAREGPSVFRNFTCYQAARLPGEYGPWLKGFGADLNDANQVMDFFTFKRDEREAKGTWLGDGLELLPFLDGLGEKGNQHADS